MDITVLGEARYPSPLDYHVSDKARVPFSVIIDPEAPPPEELLFEVAGPREKLFFDPKKTRAGVVTCGGLCPGLNNVIRSLVVDIVLTPVAGKLEIDVRSDLAGILTIAAQKQKPRSG